jgi:hypothetical protein
MSAQITLGNLLAGLTAAVLTCAVLWVLYRLLSERMGAAVGVVSERIDSSLRMLVVADGKAKESLAAIDAAVRRLEALEMRLNATEHRLVVLERYQVRVLDAEAELRHAGQQPPAA